MKNPPQNAGPSSVIPRDAPTFYEASTDDSKKRAHQQDDHTADAPSDGHMVNPGRWQHHHPASVEKPGKRPGQDRIIVDLPGRGHESATDWRDSFNGSFLPMTRPVPDEGIRN